MAIEYIFFDLGMVILEFDHSIALNKLAALSKQTPHQIENAIFDSGLETEFETGLIEAAEFHSRFCKATNCEINESALLEACSDIFELNTSIMPLIGQLSAVGFPKGILSNTCSAHWEHVFRTYPFLRNSFRDYVLSYESKSMKPDSKIYTDAISVAGVAADKIFFIDDRQENVDGALAAGLDAILYRSAEQVIAELLKRGVRFNL
jgi:putative hydrolase of the HAD superfamily